MVPGLLGALIGSLINRPTAKESAEPAMVLVRSGSDAPCSGL
jgi:hypothetical protein